jgi:hypothetical protein
MTSQTVASDEQREPVGPVDGWLHPSPSSSLGSRRQTAPIGQNQQLAPRCPREHEHKSAAEQRRDCRAPARAGAGTCLR